MSEELGSTPRPEVHPSHEMYWFGPSAHPGELERGECERCGFCSCCDSWTKPCTAPKSPFEEQLRQFAARETGTAMALQQTPWVSRLVQSIVDEAVRLYDEEAWRSEECIRASGEVICEECGKPYWKHAKVTDEVPTLVRACDGRLLKL